MKGALGAGRVQEMLHLGRGGGGYNRETETATDGRPDRRTDGLLKHEKEGKTHTQEPTLGHARVYDGNPTAQGMHVKCPGS